VQKEKTSFQSSNNIIKGILIGMTLFIIIWQCSNFKTNNNKPETQIIENNNHQEEVKRPELIACYEPKDEIFTWVEKMPKYAGCEILDEKLANDCTIKNIQRYTAQVAYPAEAIDMYIEGKVYIRFVVDPKGLVTEVELLSGVNKYLDHAALNHIKKMPKFVSPGYQRGKTVKVQYIIPINFKFE
jgi:TonB family protein